MTTDALTTAIAIERRALLEHPLYAEVNDVGALRTFMGLHVYAVWDFMSLLKSLQRGVTCVNIPWLPPADGEAARLVNEIVLAEESDVLADGRTLSHFALYRAAMLELGANTSRIDGFIGALSVGASLEEAFERAAVDAAPRAFVAHTLSAASDPRIHCVAASFLLGREDLVPSMFRRLLAAMPKTVHCPSFRAYLERHVELDEEQHGPLATRLLSKLCGDSPTRWHEATEAARAAIHARVALWNAATGAIATRPERVATLGE